MPPLHSLLSYPPVQAAVAKLNSDLQPVPSVPSRSISASICLGKEAFRWGISKGLLDTAGSVGLDFTRKLLSMLTQEQYIHNLGIVDDLFVNAVDLFPNLWVLGRTDLFLSVLGVMIRGDREGCKAFVAEQITPDVRPTVNHIIQGVARRLKFRPGVGTHEEFQYLDVMLEKDHFKMMVIVPLSAMDTFVIRVPINGRDGAGVRSRTEYLPPYEYLNSPEKKEKRGTKRKDEDVTGNRRHRKRARKAPNPASHVPV